MKTLSPSLSLSLVVCLSHSHRHCLVRSRSQWKCGKVAAEKFSDCLGTPSSKVEWGVLEDVLDWFPQMCHWGAIWK